MIEEAIQKSFYNTSQEKSFIDKLLAKNTDDKIADIIKKPVFEREDIASLLHQLASTEAKLLNFGEWDRHIQLKFYVWLREFFRIHEKLFDYRDDFKRKENTCMTCNKPIVTEKDKCKCSTKKIDYKYNKLAIKINNQRLFLGEPTIRLRKVRIPQLVLDDITKQIFENNVKLMEHNLRFLVDLYLNIGRTTLSLGGTGILELLKNKFEFAYPSMNTGTEQPMEKKQTGWFRK